MCSVRLPHPTPAEIARQEQMELANAKRNALRNREKYRKKHPKK